MTTIIGSILGALIGGFLTWLANRKKPHHIVCEELYRGWKSWKSLPDSKMLINGEPVEILGILVLKLRNIGSLAIDSPALTIHLNEDANIINVTSEISPARQPAPVSSSNVEDENSFLDSAVSTKIKNKLVDVNMDYFLPFKLNQEAIILEIFTDGKIKSVEIVGSGVLKNGTGWAATYSSKKTDRKRTLVILTALSTSSICIVFILFTVNMYVYLPQLLMLTDVSNILNEWYRAPLFHGLLGISLLTLIGHIYFGLKGRYMNIPIPFTSKELRVGFSRRR